MVNLILRELGPQIANLLELVEDEEFIFDIFGVYSKDQSNCLPGFPESTSNKYYRVSGIIKASEQRDEEEAIISEESIDTIFSQYQVGIDYVENSYLKILDRNDFIKNFVKPKGISIREANDARGIRSNIGYVSDYVDFLIERKIELDKNYLTEEEYEKATTDFISCRKAELQELTLKKVIY